MTTHGSPVRIGLITDTHIPDRCFEIPQQLEQIFAAVDFILHAGDVGELWVLDRLSRIAPVIAVHGNDDSQDSQRELPLQQLISAKGQRILLWHNHYPDRIDELTSRTDDLRPKLRRIAWRAKRCGATTAVFGHWHIPLVHEEDGVTLINPGTIELGNAIWRQLIQSVAILEIHSSSDITVTHVDLANPEQPYVPRIDIDAGFEHALNQFTRDARSPELIVDSPRLRTAFEEIVPETLRRCFHAPLNRAAHPVWLDKKSHITHQDWIDSIGETSDLPLNIRHQLIEVLREGIE